MITVDILREPTDAVYERLLRAGLRFCNAAILVVRPSLGLTAAASKLLSTIEANQVAVNDLAQQWPGTVLLDEKATVYRYHLDELLVQELITAARGLYRWRQPERPEDLCLLRSDDRPWLTSIAHENDAWLELEEHEYPLVQEISGLMTRARLR